MSADEIEHLRAQLAAMRAALEKIQNYKEQSSDPDWEKVDAMRDIAWHALGGWDQLSK